MGNFCNLGGASSTNQNSWESSLNQSLINKKQQHDQQNKQINTQKNIQQQQNKEGQSQEIPPNEGSPQNKQLQKSLSAEINPTQTIKNKQIELLAKSDNKCKQIISQDFFTIKDRIGHGAFSNVYLVVRNNQKFKQENQLRRNNQELLAMKVMQKSQIYDNQLVEKILLEKNILKTSRTKENPFFVQLKYAFQSQSKLHLVMEYVPGGNLFNLLRMVRKFTEEEACFIVAELILGIEYLHNKLKVIYRDLKPENILLTLQGHIKISDFGLSKQFKTNNDLSYSFVGTPEYIAPEIINKQGQDKKVDLWCIGIFLFELLSGCPPFTFNGSNMNELQQQILNKKLKFQSYFSEQAKHLIENLLVIDPNQRLGAKNINELKSHSFFKNIDWCKLFDQKVNSPLEKYVSQIIQARGYNKSNQGPRKIYETPDWNDDKEVLPQIIGFSYNQDSSSQANPQDSIDQTIKNTIN